VWLLGTGWGLWFVCICVLFFLWRWCCCLYYVWGTSSCATHRTGGAPAARPPPAQRRVPVLAAAPRSVGRPLRDDAATGTTRTTYGQTVTGMPCDGGGRSPAAAASSGVVAMAMSFLWATGRTAASRTCVQVLYMTLCFCSAFVASWFCCVYLLRRMAHAGTRFLRVFLFLVSMPACFGI